MKHKVIFPIFLTAAALTAGPGHTMTDADNACIDHLREVGGEDGKSGIVLSSSFSEAGTLVMLQDAGGTTWRCIAYSDGAIGEMSVVDAADDSGGASAGSDEPGTDTVVVKFESGTSGTELTGTLAPGSSTRYVLGAVNEQFLYVRVAPNNGTLEFSIWNPDGSALLDLISADKEYRGQLWQTGGHVIEVVNRTGADVSYNVVFGIE